MKKWVVLITGSSTGIGRALAVEFARQGHLVFATARKPETLAELAGESIRPLALDVTSAESINQAVETAVKQAGRIDLLINNAGFGLMGPVAELALDSLRKQLETNVVGPVAVVQAVLPVMLRQGSGRIVNVGSVSGVLPTPFAGAYCASKAAIHAITDAMRMELAPLGIEVISLQPGGVRSNFGETAAQDLKLKAGSPYARIATFIEARAKAGQADSITADEFAKQMVPYLLAEQPPIILRRGPNSIKLPLFRWLLPVRLVDRIFAKRFGLTRMKRGS